MNNVAQLNTETNVLHSHISKTELSRDTLNGIGKLSEILRGIHTRLLNEGNIIENGRIYKPVTENKNTTDN